MYLRSGALIALLLCGCSKSTQCELVYDISQCTKQEQRALMLCKQSGHGNECRIECRDYAERTKSESTHQEVQETGQD
jgi:hypothetical protein